MCGEHGFEVPLWVWEHGFGGPTTLARFRPAPYAEPNLARVPIAAEIPSSIEISGWVWFNGWWERYFEFCSKPWDQSFAGESHILTNANHLETPYGKCIGNVLGNV